jgi:hypothetical protein
MLFVIPSGTNLNVIDCECDQLWPPEGSCEANQEHGSISCTSQSMWHVSQHLLHVIVRARRFLRLCRPKRAPDALPCLSDDSVSHRRWRLQTSGIVRLADCRETTAHVAGFETFICH